MEKGSVQRALPERGIDAHGNADGEDDEQGHEAELRGDPHLGEDDFGDVAVAVGEALAQLAVSEVLQVDAVLLEERLVEPLLVADARQDLGVAVLAHRHANRVAGTEARDGEGDERHRQEDDRHPEEPPDDVGEEPLHRATALTSLARAYCSMVDVAQIGDHHRRQA